MRRLLLLLALAWAAPSFAQTTVNFTVTDTPDNQTWNNGTWTVQLQRAAGDLDQTRTFRILSGGGSTANQSGTLSSTGTASVVLPANANIAPVGTIWQFVVCSQQGTSCFTSNAVVVTSSPQTLSINPPSIRVASIPNLPPILAYTTAEISSAAIGSQITVVGSTPSQPTLETCVAISGIICTTWVSSGTGGGPPGGVPPQTQVNDPGNPGHFGGTACENFPSLTVGPANEDCDTHFKGNNPWIEPARFGASGSIQFTTGTISTGSAALTLNSAIDFKNNQGIAVYGIGPLSTLSAPTISSVTQVAIPTYVAATPGAITCNGAGTAATVTTIGAHGFPVGGSVTISNATAPYAGTFTITTIGGLGQPNQFTFNVTCTANQQISATTSNWNVVLNAGSTTFTYGVCAVDALNGCVPSAATTQITTANPFAVANQGMATYYVKVTGAAVTGGTMYAIYRNGTCIGAAELPGANGTTWTYNDFGGSQGCPVNLPTSPFPTGATPQILISSIVSGSGSTSVTLANAATFGTSTSNCTGTASCGRVEHDDTVAINNAMTVACTQTQGGGDSGSGIGTGGAWVHFALSNYNVQTWNLCHPTPQFSQAMKISIYGKIVARQPIYLNFTNYQFYGVAGSGAAPGSNTNGAIIEGFNTYPVFMCDTATGGGGCQTENITQITFQGKDGVPCSGTCIHLVQGGSFLLQDVNATNNSDATSPALFIDGTTGASAIIVERGTYGQAGTHPTSYTRSIHLLNAGNVQFRQTRLTLQGYAFQNTAGSSGTVSIDGGVMEVSWDSPFLFVANSGSGMSQYLIRNFENADTTSNTDFVPIKIENGTQLGELRLDNMQTTGGVAFWEALGSSGQLFGYQIGMLGNGSNVNSRVPTVFNNNSAGIITNDVGHQSLYMIDASNRGPGFQIFCQISSSNPFNILNANSVVTAAFSCPSGSLEVGPESAYDNFNRANGDVGGNWTSINGVSRPSITSNAVNSNTAGATWGASSFVGDQFAQWTAVTASNGTVFQELLVRAIGFSFPLNSYACASQGASGDGIFKFVSGVSSLISTSGVTISWVAGDVFRCSVFGSTITMTKNGVVVASVTDTTYTSGAPGFFFTGNGLTFDNWSGGTLHPIAQLDSEQDWTQPQHFIQPVTIGPTNPVPGALNANTLYTNGNAFGSVYATASATTGASIGTTTMVTAPASGAKYVFNATAAQVAGGTSCTTNSTLALFVNYTDAVTNAAQVPILGGYSIQAATFAGNAAPVLAINNGTANTMAINWNPMVINAKASTTVSYGTTYTAGAGCAPTPTYYVTPSLVQVQ